MQSNNVKYMCAYIYFFLNKCNLRAYFSTYLYRRVMEISKFEDCKRTKYIIKKISVFFWCLYSY